MFIRGCGGRKKSEKFVSTINVNGTKVNVTLDASEKYLSADDVAGEIVSAFSKSNIAGFSAKKVTEDEVVKVKITNTTTGAESKVSVTDYSFTAKTTA